MQRSISNIVLALSLLTTCVQSLVAMDSQAKRPLDDQATSRPQKRQKISDDSPFDIKVLTDAIQHIAQANNAHCLLQKGNLRPGCLSRAEDVEQKINKTIDQLFKQLNADDVPPLIFVETLNLLYEAQMLYSMPAIKISVDKETEAVIKNLVILRTSGRKTADLVPTILELKRSVGETALRLLLRAKGAYCHLKDNEQACAVFMKNEACNNLEKATLLLALKPDNEEDSRQFTDGENLEALNKVLNYLFAATALKGIPGTQEDRDSSIDDAITLLLELNHFPLVEQAATAFPQANTHAVETLIELDQANSPVMPGEEFSDIPTLGLVVNLPKFGQNISSYFQKSPTITYSNCLFAPGTKSPDVKNGYLCFHESIKESVDKNIQFLYLIKKIDNAFWIQKIFITFITHGVSYKLEATERNEQKKAVHNLKVLNKFVEYFYGDDFKTPIKEVYRENFKKFFIGLQVPGLKDTFPVLLLNRSAIKENLTEGLKTEFADCAQEMFNYPLVDEAMIKGAIKKNSLLVSTNQYK